MDRKNRKHGGKGSHILQDMTLSGDMESDTDICIEGEIRGNVTSMQCLSVHSSGNVYGHVRCSGLLLDGSIRGDVRVMGQAVLRTGALIEGNLSVRSLEVQSGACVRGRLEFIN